MYRAEVGGEMGGFPAFQALGDLAAAAGLYLELG